MLLKKSLLREFQQEFLKERNLAYRIPLSQKEIDASCAGKHLRLMKFCQKAHLPVRQRIVFFQWEDLALPKELLALNTEKEPSHLYLEISDGETWNQIDATWDPGLIPLVPINSWSDFEIPMQIAVEPRKTLSPEESKTYMEGLKNVDLDTHLKRHRPFLEGLNTYFEEMRSRV